MENEKAGLFSLKVIASNKFFFDGKARYLRLQTLDGQIAIMAHHAPIVAAVEVGELDVQAEDGHWMQVEVGKGILHFANNRLTLLVDTLETAEELDVRRAQEAKERAMEQLRQKQSVQEYKMSQASLARALSRLEFSRKHYNI